MTSIQCCELNCTATARYITLVGVDDDERAEMDPSLALCQVHARIIWPMLLTDRPPVHDLLRGTHSVALDSELVRQVVEAVASSELRRLVEASSEKQGIGGFRKP